MSDADLISFGVAMLFVAGYGVYLHVRNEFAYGNWEREEEQEEQSETANVV